MTYRELIRSFQANWKKEVNPSVKFVAKSTNDWDLSPESDVDQSEYPQEGFWTVEADVDFDDDPCQFF